MARKRKAPDVPETPKAKAKAKAKAAAEPKTKAKSTPKRAAPQQSVLAFPSLPEAKQAKAGSDAIEQHKSTQAAAPVEMQPTVAETSIAEQTLPSTNQETPEVGSVQGKNKQAQNQADQSSNAETAPTVVGSQPAKTNTTYSTAAPGASESTEEEPTLLRANQETPEVGSVQEKSKQVQDQADQSSNAETAQACLELQPAETQACTCSTAVPVEEEQSTDSKGTELQTETAEPKLHSTASTAASNCNLPLLDTLVADQDAPDYLHQMKLVLLQPLVQECKRHNLFSHFVRHMKDSCWPDDLSQKDCEYEFGSATDLIDFVQFVKQKMAKVPSTLSLDSLFSALGEVDSTESQQKKELSVMLALLSDADKDELINQAHVHPYMPEFERRMEGVNEQSKWKFASHQLTRFLDLETFIGWLVEINVQAELPMLVPRLQRETTNHARKIILHRTLASWSQSELANVIAEAMRHEQFSEYRTLTKKSADWLIDGATHLGEFILWLSNPTSDGSTEPSSTQMTVQSCLSSLGLFAVEERAMKLEELLGAMSDSALDALIAESREHPELPEHIKEMKIGPEPVESDWEYGGEEGDPLEDVKCFIRWLSTRHANAIDAGPSSPNTQTQMPPPVVAFISLLTKIGTAPNEDQERMFDSIMASSSEDVIDHLFSGSQQHPLLPGFVAMISAENGEVWEYGIPENDPIEDLKDFALYITKREHSESDVSSLANLANYLRTYAARPKCEWRDELARMLYMLPKEKFEVLLQEAVHHPALNDYLRNAVGSLGSEHISEEPMSFGNGRCDRADLECFMKWFVSYSDPAVPDVPKDSDSVALLSASPASIGHFAFHS